MVIRFYEEEERIQKEISKIYSSKEMDTSTIGLSIVAAKTATTPLVELINPIIMTKTDELHIMGRVYMLSALQLKTSIQRKYLAENFPRFVDDYIKHGRINREFANLRRFELSEAIQDLDNLRTIYHGNENKTVIFLSRIGPTILPVTEYTISEGHTSGIRPLKAIEAPLIVKASEARFPFTSPEAKITDGRTEFNMVARLTNFHSIINGVKSTVRINEEGGERVRLRDTLSILSIVFLIFGIGLTFVRRARTWEIGLPLIVIGIIIFYFRYFSDWSKEYFTPGRAEISGDVLTELSFFGELI